MEIEILPEVKLARKIIVKHSLKIPFDLDSLVKEYADLIYRSIPFSGIDGVSLNLKTPGKKPLIIVNSNIQKQRQFFTLAHELGHIIIPWHLGTIVDEVYSSAYKDFFYGELEQEANRFAAELIMPKEWIESEIKEHTGSISELHISIASKSKASYYSTAIRLMEYLPPNIIYVVEKLGGIMHSGKSNGTIAYLQKTDEEFNFHFYEDITNYSAHEISTIKYHWYELSSNIEILTEDERSWREILDGIIKDINPPEGASKFKMTINGIFGSVNSSAQRKENYNIDTVITNSIYKLRRKGLEEFISHSDFKNFVKNRVIELFDKK